MIIKGVDNQSVELRIVNYEFPASRDKEYDGNWLTIYLNVKSKFGNWQVTDPSLLTWEVEELINWIRTLSINKNPDYTEQEFIEPNLSFHLLNNYSYSIKQIRINFDLESRPKSADDDKEYFVILEANNNDLERIAIDLEKELKKYPVRK